MIRRRKIPSGDFLDFETKALYGHVCFCLYSEDTSFQGMEKKINCDASRVAVFALARIGADHRTGVAHSARFGHGPGDVPTVAAELKFGKL